MKNRELVKTTLIIIACFIIGALWYLSPIMKPFPPLTGTYAVGIQTVEITDETRNDPFSEDRGNKRKLVLHIWYPAARTSQEQKARYLGTKMAHFQRAFAALYHLPRWSVKLMFRSVKTNAYLNAPLSNEKSSYPVILFSHGLLGLPSDMYTSLLENLASHGFIVFGIDHPSLNWLTLYNNGVIVTSQELSQRFEKMTPQEQHDFQSRAIAIYKADMQSVVNYLTKLNTDEKSIFHQHLDLNRQVVMGHSAGGTAAIEYCRTDSRCKAAIDLDGWYDHIIGLDPIKKPLLLLLASKSREVLEPSPEYLKRKQLTREQYFERERKIDEHIKAVCNDPDCTMAMIEGEHGNFGDELFLKWPFREWNAAESYKTFAANQAHLLKFLKKV